MNFSRAITAGFIGGVLVDLFLIAVRAAPFPGIYQFIASTVVGPVAFASDSYIALGVCMHFAISIVFALAYSFAAERWRALNENPVLWGSVFGVIVMFVMQGVLAVAHASPPPSVMGFVMGLISHVVFFGLPIAFYVARTNRRRRLTA